MASTSRWWWISSLVICHWSARSSQQENYELPVGVLLKDGDTFDYVVVGAGASGCAVAARLALRGRRVLLVEAGGDPNPLSYVPAASMGLLGSDVDWQYKTISNNKSCLSSIGKACQFSRGKCLGGSTSINYMMFVRGNRQDYDDFGIPGWTWDDLKPYFLKYEGLQDFQPLPESSLPFHNDSGILKIDYFADPENPWHSKLVSGLKHLGFPSNPDVNGVSQIGVSQVSGYTYEGERMSTARAYLTPDEVKRALTVAKNTFCTGVILDDDNVARGITVVQNSINITLNIYARNEVILSAGTIGTPQILMLSGIGPADHLREMGIPVRIDLPVGNDMSDHVLPLMLVLVDRGVRLLDTLQELTGSAVSLVEYLAERAGPLASNNLVDITAFVNTTCYDCCKRKLRKSRDCRLPSLQLISAYVGRGLLTLAKPLFQNAVNLDEEAIDQVAAANADNAIIIMSPIVLQPHSRGRIRLASVDPLAPPAIFPNYLDDERDVDEMLRSIRIVEDLMRTPPFRRNGARLLHLKLSGCPRARVGRDGRGRAAYWRCYARHMTYAVFHAVGTCQLRAAVDAALRVRGARRLRVADASVLPRVPRGNTEAVCVAIGERAADLILRDRDDRR